MIAPYPGADATQFDAGAEKEIDGVIEIVRAIRNVRAQYKVASGRWIEAKIYSGSSTFSKYLDAMKSLARANPVNIIKGEASEKAGENLLVIPLAPATIVIPMESMVDLETEKKSLLKEMGILTSEIARLQDRVKDEAFLSKAPPAVIEKERQRLYTLSEKLEKLKRQSSR
jgi:valyl-tRNA synthetase